LKSRLGVLTSAGYRTRGRAAALAAEWIAASHHHSAPPDAPINPASRIQEVVEEEELFLPGSWRLRGPARRLEAGKLQPGNPCFDRTLCAFPQMGSLWGIQELSKAAMIFAAMVEDFSHVYWSFRLGPFPRRC
jgi:hypothetical protein